MICGLFQTLMTIGHVNGINVLQRLLPVPVNTCLPSRMLLAALRRKIAIINLTSP